MLGATRLAALCEELERQARNDAAYSPGDLVERIAAEFEGVVAALREQIEAYRA